MTGTRDTSRFLGFANEAQIGTLHPLLIVRYGNSNSLKVSLSVLIQNIKIGWKDTVPDCSGVQIYLPPDTEAIERRD